MLWIILLVPEVLGKIMSDVAHVADESQASRMALSVISSIVLYAIVDELISLWILCC